MPARSDSQVCAHVGYCPQQPVAGSVFCYYHQKIAQGLTEPDLKDRRGGRPPA